MWVSTHAERLAEVESVLGQAGLAADAHVFTGTHAGGGDLAGLVEQAFDLDAIARQYDEFIAEFSDGPAPDPLARVVELVHSWRRFPWLDPDLPAALLPGRLERYACGGAVQEAAWRLVASRAGRLAGAVGSIQRGTSRAASPLRSTQFISPRRRTTSRMARQLRQRMIVPGELR